MIDKKKPGEPVEEVCREQEIRLLRLNEQFLCVINGTPIQNVKSYSCVQSSSGSVLLNLTIEVNVGAVSTTIQAQMQQHQ